MLVEFGEMTPDRPAQGLELALNVLPNPQGYSPAKSFQELAPALPGWLGGGAFVSKAGTTSFLSGDGSNLYRLDAGAWAIRVAAPAQIWRFIQFGDNIICVNGGAPITYNMATDTAAVTPDSPPQSDLVGVVRDFVVLAGDPAAQNRVTWSGFNDSNEWTGGTNQAGSQELPEGGEVTGIAGGEYGIIFQQTAVTRMTFVGDQLVFTFDKISENTGCIAKGSVAQAGRLIFFLSERGFMVTEGNDITPIGVEKVDETFLKTYARSELGNIRAAVDPRRHIVVWAMPGRLWCYNWVIQKWSVIDLPNRGVFSGFNTDVSIDEVDAAFSSNADTLPISFDSVQLQGGSPLFLAVTLDGTVGTLTGDNLEASFKVPDREFGEQVRVNSLRLMGDAYNSAVELRGKLHRGAPEVVRSTATRRANGDLPIRLRSRTVKANVTIPAGEDWTYADGLDFRLTSGGRR